ncbi:hypothetical protein P8452_34265 [Trifolium repens]|nr:hypothetical protein P8452_34265 [Trifolium repens]
MAISCGRCSCRLWTFLVQVCGMHGIPQDRREYKHQHDQQNKNFRLISDDCDTKKNMQICVLFGITSLYFWETIEGGDSSKEEVVVTDLVGTTRNKSLGKFWWSYFSGFPIKVITSILKVVLSLVVLFRAILQLLCLIMEGLMLNPL